ncbi:MAG: KH domain-containing protein [Oscillospiraceae bacterium]|nr:KH domain-containing protein [Oscillospiraceae bacterium]
MTEIFTASTLEEAKQMAADAFGAAVSDIQFTVLEEPKRSLFGGLFGKNSEYRVEASYEPAAPVSAAVPAEPAEPEASFAAEETDEAETAPADEAEKVEYDPVIALEKMAVALDYLRKVLAELAPGTTAEGKLGNGIELSISGENAGIIIGRRGDTLDALQYLTSMVANRGDKDYIRLTIDACGYREKRRKALQELAQRISRTVLKTGRATMLEPMNPYERRIIHSEVTAIEGVSSRSVGEEPYRKVIISNDASPNKGLHDQKGGYRHGDRSERRGERGDRYDRGRGRGGRRGDRRPSGEGPRKLDLSTSFEKDYKRPKPEDAINTGVYGKIDI